MNTSRKHPPRRIVFAMPVAARVAPIAALALLRPRVIDLAELTRCIAADRNLRLRITEAASSEHGWCRPRIDEAIVLLGQHRLCALLTDATRLKGANK